MIKGQVVPTVVGIRVYTAILNQTGTAAPVATVLNNTLGKTISWQRVTTGQYLGTLSSGVIDPNVSATFIGSANTTGKIIRAQGNGGLIITATNLSGTSEDGISNVAVELRIYNIK